MKKLKSRYFAKFACGIFILMSTVTLLCDGFLQEEFGNAVGQDIKSVSATDSDVEEVIKYAQQYTRKRYPWSVPSAQIYPEVKNLKKKLLIYSHDDGTPMYYDDEVTDRTGVKYGITRYIILGKIYNFDLIWIENKINFCHVYTLSTTNQEKHISIYAHTFILQSHNNTNSVSGSVQYLFPKAGSSYFKHFADSGQFSFASEFSYLEMPEEELKETFFKTPGGDSAEFEGLKNRKSSTLEKDGAFKHLKVMSYNIWHMNSKSTRVGGYTERMNRLKQAILKADADVIALQEVRYEESKGEDLGPCQISMLSEWLPQYQYVFQPAQMQLNTPYEGRTEEGVAIMSKYPILSHDSIMLFINRSNSADTHQRVLLQADIFVPDFGMVHIFNTHLSLSHEAREKSVVQIWNHVKKLKGPAIVCGDLNAEPHEPAMQYLSGKAVFPGEERSGLVDVWSKLYPENKGFTFNTLDENLTKRIDYIYYRSDDQCCEVEDCYIPDDGGRRYKAASDHLPLMAELLLKTKTKPAPDSS